MTVLLTSRISGLYAQVMSHFLDRLGISASILCGIHCLFTPLLVLASPALGNIFSHTAFHWIVAAVVFPVAAISLWLGYRLHRFPQMLYLGGLGLLFVVLGIYAGADEHNSLETGAMIVAGVLLTSAHFLNLRACRAAHVRSAEGQPSPPHDHSSCAKASRKEPGSSKF